MEDGHQPTETCTSGRESREDSCATAPAIHEFEDMKIIGQVVGLIFNFSKSK